MKHPDAHIRSLLDALASPRLATIDLSLDRMRRLMEALGNPEERLPPVVHVAGTNGKGSLLAYLFAICGAQGLRAHRYTSPHLVRFNERIVLAGREINDAFLREILERLLPVMERHPVTFFEATTALAFMAFERVPADILLLETGLGGRLDATNILARPALCAITPVSIDHAEFLGNTLTAIAGEKAGILKAGVPCVVGPQRKEAMDVIEREAARLGAPLSWYGREWHATQEKGGWRYRSSSRDSWFAMPPLPGNHQLYNAATAVACIDALSGFTFHPHAVAQGIADTTWPARLQHLVSGALVMLLAPGMELWLDGGHNPAAGTILADWVRQQHKPVHVICGMLRNKDIGEFLDPLAPVVRSLTAVSIEGEPLSRQASEIADAARQKSLASRFSDNIKDAIKTIVLQEKNECIVLVCGSLYLAGNILWQNSQAS